MWRVVLAAVSVAYLRFLPYPLGMPVLVQPSLCACAPQITEGMRGALELFVPPNLREFIQSDLCSKGQLRDASVVFIGLPLPEVQPDEDIRCDWRWVWAAVSLCLSGWARA